MTGGSADSDERRAFRGAVGIYFGRDPRRWEGPEMFPLRNFIELNDEAGVIRSLERKENHGT